jgi:nucleoside-diphosphate-sugar epimerase
MVIGNGMVAKIFKSYKKDDHFLIFASGISNSKNTDSVAYNREIELLQNTIAKNKEKTLVYFSTCSIYDPEEKNSKYVLHKKEIESLIQKHQKQFYIFRVSNLVGKSGNPNTVLNFFVYHIRNTINFDLWSNATRNLLDIDDMCKIIDYILQKRLFKNQVINIANPVNYKVHDIIIAIEKILNMKANYISIAKGKDFVVDISLISPLFAKLNIHFEKTYLINLLQKYYTF